MKPAVSTFPSSAKGASPLWKPQSGLCPDNPLKGFHPLRIPFGTAQHVPYQQGSRREYGRAATRGPALMPQRYSYPNVLISQTFDSEHGVARCPRRQPCCGGRPAKALRRPNKNVHRGPGATPPLWPPGGFWFFSPRRKEHPCATAQSARIATLLAITDRPHSRSADIIPALHLRAYNPQRESSPCSPQILPWAAGR